MVRRLDAGWGMVGFDHEGPGDPILWLHGYTLDSRIWDDLFARLPGRRHIALDLPGHGASGPLSAGLTRPVLARRICAFAQDVGARHLVGLSFGGLIALEAAMTDPPAFATLTLGAPALAGGPLDRHAQARNRALAALYRERGTGPWLRDLWMQSPPDIFTGAAAHPALWARLRAIVGDHRWDELADDRMRPLLTGMQSPSDLGRIKAATLVLIGSDDAEPFRRSAEMIRRAIPDCRRVRLDDTGHLTLIERPDAAATLLAAHLDAATMPETA